MSDGRDATGTVEKPRVFLARHRGAQEKCRENWVGATQPAPLALLAALALTACGGQSTDDPDPTVTWSEAGLHVTEVYGEAVVRQQVPSRMPARWELVSDGFLWLEYFGDVTIGNVRTELTGDDLVVVHVDGAVLRPDAAWVEVEGEVVAE